MYYQNDSHMHCPHFVTEFSIFDVENNYCCYCVKATPTLDPIYGFMHLVCNQEQVMLGTGDWVCLTNFRNVWLKDDLIGKGCLQSSFMEFQNL